MPFYSERSSWSRRDAAIFQEGLERAGPQAVSDFAEIAAARKNETVDRDIAPKIPGNFFVPEKK